MSSGEGVRQRWMIYALGGGAGHLTRVTALARAALQQLQTSSGTQSESALAPDICILTNSPFASVIPVEHELGDGHQLIQIDSHLSRDEVTTEVYRVLETQAFDVLVVDTFPRGLAGELPEILASLSCPSVLIHRDLNPKYVAQYGVKAVAEDYDLILVPGESAEFDSMPQAVRTEPWLIRDCDQLLSVAEARDMLGVTDHSTPVIVVMGSGTEAELQEMERLATELDAKFGSVGQIRFVAPNLGDVAGDRLRIWPLLEVMPGISIMIGSGGYNTVKEAKATGTHLIGIARERLYDRQERRLSKLCQVNRATDVVDVAEQLSTLLADGVESMKSPTYVNGVHQAVLAITQLVQQKDSTHQRKEARRRL